MPREVKPFSCIKGVIVKVSKGYFKNKLLVEYNKIEYLIWNAKGIKSLIKEGDIVHGNFNAHGTKGNGFGFPNRSFFIRFVNGKHIQGNIKTLIEYGTG